MVTLKIGQILFGKSSQKMLIAIKFNSSFKSTDLRLIDRPVIVLSRLLEKLTSGKSDYMYVT